MRIQLDREYILKGDEHEVALVQVRRAASGKRAGEIVESVVGHYRDVPQALEAFATRKARMSDVTTIRGYIDTLRQIREEIGAMCREAA